MRPETTPFRGTGRLAVMATDPERSRSPRAHPTLVRALVGVTASLALVVAAVSAYAYVGYNQAQRSVGSPAIELHSSTPGLTSPTQALAYAVMACMGMDVVHVLQKARHELKAMHVRFDGERMADHPRRFVAMKVHFELTANVRQANPPEPLASEVR